MQRILVTGGAGFLGSHLCERLTQKGHSVLCVDNYYTGSKRNISHLLGDAECFELLRHDVTFPLFVEVEQIYNMACPASPVHYQYDPVQTTKTSVHGAINMLGLAKRLKARICKLLLVKYMAAPKSIHKRKTIGARLTQLGRVLVTMKGKDALRHCFLITIGSIVWRSK